MSAKRPPPKPTVLLIVSDEQGNVLDRIDLADLGDLSKPLPRAAMVEEILTAPVLARLDERRKLDAAAGKGRL